MRQSLNIAAGVTADTSVEAMERANPIEDALQTLSDGARGYRTLGEEIESAELKPIIATLAAKRSETVETLLRAATEAGVDFEPKTDGTLSGAAHRAWLKLESAIKGDDALVESAEAAEEHAIGQLEEALETVTIEPLADHLRAAIDSIRGAKDQLAHWRENSSS